jgi:hypothetical protein
MVCLMPDSFVSFHIQNTDAEGVAAAARGVVRGLALISPVAGGWVSLYDRTSETLDVYEIERVASEISAALGTLILVFLAADPTLFVYYLFDTGGLIDEYRSTATADSDDPNADPAGRFEGRPQLLLPLCRKGVQRSQIERALAKTDSSHGMGFGTTVPATDRIELLATALGIDTARATIGYDDLRLALRSFPDAAGYIPLDGRRDRRFAGRVPPKPR